MINEQSEYSSVLCVVKILLYLKCLKILFRRTKHNMKFIITVQQLPWKCEGKDKWRILVLLFC